MLTPFLASNLCFPDIWPQSTILSADPPQFALPPRYNSEEGSLHGQGDTRRRPRYQHLCRQLSLHKVCRKPDKQTQDDIHPVLLPSILEDTCRGPGLDWPHRHQPLHMTWTGRDQDPPDLFQSRGENSEGGPGTRGNCGYTLRPLQPSSGRALV